MRLRFTAARKTPKSKAARGFHNRRRHGIEISQLVDEIGSLDNARDGATTHTRLSHKGSFLSAKSYDPEQTIGVVTQWSVFLGLHEYP